MTIDYYARNTYGKMNYYFLEDTSETRAIQRLTGMRTLTVQNIEALKLLGIDMVPVLDPQSYAPGPIRVQ